MSTSLPDVRLVSPWPGLISPGRLTLVDVIIPPVVERLLHLTDTFRRNHSFFLFLRTASDVAIPANAVIPCHEDWYLVSAVL